MQADILVLDQHSAGFEYFRNIDILLDVERRYSKALAQIVFRAVLHEIDATGRADVSACITFNTVIGSKHGLGIAIEAPLGLNEGGFGIESKFDFKRPVLQSLFRSTRGTASRLSSTGALS